MKKIGVVGLGKLGLPLAALLAERNFEVYGYDSSTANISKLNNKNYDFTEPRLNELLIKNEKRLSFQNDLSKIIEITDAVFVIVPTPSNSDGMFSNEALIDVVKQIGISLRGLPDKRLIINIVSTVMPGSCEKVLIPELERSLGKKLPANISLCYNPEFIALGSVISDMENADMHLIGGQHAWATNSICEILGKLTIKETPTSQMNLTEAEIVKIAVNNFVTMKISYANSLFQAASIIGKVDIDVITNAIGLDSRIGRKYLKGAAPYGGPCFPRDTRALDAFFVSLGMDNSISKSIDDTNSKHIAFISKLVSENLIKNEIIGVAGLSYKLGTPVIEESPGVSISKKLHEMGFRVITWDDEGALTGNPNIPVVNFDEFISKSNFILITRPLRNRESLTQIQQSGVPFLDLWRQ